MDKLVAMPNLEITLNPDINGCYVLESACWGKFRTESRITAMSVMGEWMDHQERIIQQVIKQRGIEANGEA